MFISNLILKAFDSLWKSKKFSSRSFQAFKSYIFAIQGIKKKQQSVSNFFSKQTCLKNGWRNSLHYQQRRNEKRLWMNEKMMTLTFLKLYTDYKKIRRILFPYSLTNLFKQWCISFVKGTLMQIWKSPNVFAFI